MTLPNLKPPSVPSSPVQAVGGSPDQIREGNIDINRTQQVGKDKIPQNQQATQGKTCQLGSPSVVGADNVVEVVGVLPITAPEAPKIKININDNYCLTEPVLANWTLVGTTRTLDSLNFQTSVNYSVVSPVPFARKFVRQPQKKGLSPHVESKVQIKSVNCVSFVDHCVSVPSVTSAHNAVCAPPVGGRLQPFWQTWARLGANPRVVSVLKVGYVLLFKLKPPLVRHPLIVSGYANPDRNKSLRDAVQSLVDKKAVEMVRVRASLAFFNRLFIVPKPNQKWRPVLDLSALNKFLSVKTFKLETPETIRISLQQGEWVTSLDFSNAYFHIPIHSGSRKYLRFHFQNQSFQFRALPFGLSTAPMEFTCVVKEVKLMAQSWGIRIHQYLDDWLI